MPNYEDYLNHFFNNARTSIREGKNQELLDNLTHIADLICEAIDRSGALDDRFNSNYSFCRRQYVQLYIEVLDNGSDEDLRSSIINSISAVVNYSRQASDLEAFDQLLESLTKCYMQTYPKPGFDKGIDNFFETYSTIQYGVTQHFEEVNNVERLASSAEFTDTFLKHYRSLWRSAVKNECEESIRRLDHNLKDIKAFESYQYTPIGKSENEDEVYLEKKEKIATNFHRRVQVQKFAAYSWGYNIHMNEGYSNDTFITKLLRDYAENDFPSVEDFSKTYFNIESVLDGVPYWDQWDMDRQLDNAIGAVVSAMGTNSWIMSFYLAFSIYLFDEKSQDKLSNSPPEELPFPIGSKRAIKINQLKDIIEKFRNDYPLDFLLNDQADLDTRIDKLAKTLDRAHSHAKKQQLMDIRNQPVNPELIDDWRVKLNEKFEHSCLLRQAMREIGLLEQRRFPPNNDGIKLSKGYFERRNFVPEEAVHKTPPSNFRTLFEDYRRYVIRQLDLEEYSVNDTDELLDEIELQSKRKNPSVILLQTGEHRRQLLDDNRFENGGNIPNAHYSFSGVPVLTEPTETYTALLLRENESFGIEFVEDEQFLEMTATPGEEADVLDTPTEPLESVPYRNAPQDFVELEIRLRGFIWSKDLDGVIFHIESDRSD